MDLSNNTILITGGGSGIGFTLAKKFIQLNNRVIICGRNLEKLKAAKQKYPSIEIIQCDVSDEHSVETLVQEILETHPNLNFLVNNAGIMKMWNIRRETTNIREQKKEILTNFFGTVQLTQSLIPHLLGQKNSAVLNVSSGLAFVPMSAAPIYNATKAAIHSYSISIRQQLQNTAIKIFEVLPAAIETQMATDMEKIIGIENSGPKMSPEKLAELTIKGIKNDTYEIRPGMANMLYHLHRFTPSLAQNMIRKQSEKILLKL
ncbi:SDR family oxidoreductase [Mucilaginibacter ginsenosidivorans]|uniref:SDR family NAD(P)-dependent oxidoreductase n=1 Tax=Mucilaginibacter ginsenosidivorans TaxID=398053 RepID=A0A5B8URI9_9SPHI|nr:SDR family NAD(P)-dependent oxidoreductase [Mucilaginibacter ginsenosidivorans]QEC61468.1 SDR family NAD(P)-dependent oxidoreductase [Mucilaginibacter ginsenosidivorans]